MRFVAAAVLATALAGAAGCGDDERAAPPPQTTTRIDTTPGRTVLADIPANVRRPFLRRCIEARGEEQRFLCSCILVRLHNSLLPREVAVIAREGSKAPEPLRRRVERAARSCRRER